MKALTLLPIILLAAPLYAQAPPQWYWSISGMAKVTTEAGHPLNASVLLETVANDYISDSLAITVTPEDSADLSTLGPVPDAPARCWFFTDDEGHIAIRVVGFGWMHLIPPSPDWRRKVLLDGVKPFSGIYEVWFFPEENVGGGSVGLYLIRK